MILLDSDMDIAARTIYGEARGELDEGKVAVARVIINRWKTSYGGASTLAQVCLRPKAFSCWNKGDLNLEAIKRASPDSPLFRSCMKALLDAFGLHPDPVMGARWYHTIDAKPSWAEGKAPVAQVGRHLYYVGIDGPEPPQPDLTTHKMQQENT